MQILFFPIALILWYLAYDAKPIGNDDVTDIWEENNLDKRSRLLNILNERF